MKNINAIAGPLLALGFWLLAAQPGQCFYQQGARARASTPAPDGAAIGTPPVQHEYGPFGEVIRATGPMAKANPFRFSTKYQDDETDLLYYGCRYYTPSTGRWLSRDPAEEEGGENLYIFAGNQPITFIDPTGLEWKIMRNWGDRALAIPQCRDTIADLAKRIGLDENEYARWLRAE